MADVSILRSHWRMGAANHPGNYVLTDLLVGIACETSLSMLCTLWNQVGGLGKPPSLPYMLCLALHTSTQQNCQSLHHAS